MGAYKDKGGRWYVSVRYKNWLGEPSRKTKRGFTTKRDALAHNKDKKFIDKQMKMIVAILNLLILTAGLVLYKIYLVCFLLWAPYCKPVLSG